MRGQPIVILDQNVIQVYLLLGEIIDFLTAF